MSRSNKLPYIVFILCCMSLLPHAVGAQRQDAHPCLEAIAERLHHPRAKDSLAVRIFHVGDSHVKGGPFTAAIASALEQVYGESCVYASSGINGSTYQTWMAEQNIKQIVDAKPDLLIVSLGTNDCYSTRFSPDQMRQNMLDFYTEVRKHLPKLCIVYTTPPANYLRQRKRVVRGSTKGRNGKRRTLYRYINNYQFNEQTDRARQLIISLAQDQGMHYIDLNSYIGTKAEAISWLKQGLMQQDHVHYTAEGYSKQGQWVAESLLKTLDEYSLSSERND